MRRWGYPMSQYGSVMMSNGSCKSGAGMTCLGHEGVDYTVSNCSIDLEWLKSQATILTDSNVVDSCESSRSASGNSNERLDEKHFEQ